MSLTAFHTDVLFKDPLPTFGKNRLCKKCGTILNELNQNDICKHHYEEIKEEARRRMGIFAINNTKERRPIREKLNINGQLVSVDKSWRSSWHKLYNPHDSPVGIDNRVKIPGLELHLE